MTYFSFELVSHSIFTVLRKTHEVEIVIVFGIPNSTSVQMFGQFGSRRGVLKTRLERPSSSLKPFGPTNFTALPNGPTKHGTFEDIGADVFRNSDH